MLAQRREDAKNPTGTGLGSGYHRNGCGSCLTLRPLSWRAWRLGAMKESSVTGANVHMDAKHCTESRQGYGFG